MGEQNKTAKWCEYCRKDDHSDAECWSTRVIGVHDVNPAPMKMPTAFAWPKEFSALAAAPKAEPAPSAGQIDEWKSKAADYDRLAGVARNRRHVLEEIAGSRPLTATPQQFANHLQRLAKKACENYTFAGNDDAALAAQQAPAQPPAKAVREGLTEADLPMHPEPHSHTWSALEKRCILAWANSLLGIPATGGEGAK